MMALLVAGCGPSQQPGSNQVDIGNAARAAQAYRNAATPEQPTAPRTASASKASPTPTPTSASMSQAPFAPDSPEAAADVVQTYFALIEDGHYRDAWLLWDRDGAASGMTAPAFAASFDRYRDYHAEVGAPDRINAGAGQRYVTVPVTIYGTLKSGEPFAMNGEVTLHRTADIEGASEAQRRWRIHETSLRKRPVSASSPTPSATPDGPADHVSLRYRCIDGSRFRASFDNRRATVTLTIGKRSVTLTSKRPASGIWYAGAGYELEGKGDAATLTRAGAPPLPCTAIR